MGDIEKRIRKLWHGGITAAQIAEDFDISREEVIAVANGGELGGSPADPPKKAARTPKPKAPPKVKAVASQPPQVPEPPTLEIVDDVILPSTRCTLMDLTSAKCHWPIGDPRHPDFFFCGGKPLTGSSYCGYHTRMAYKPAPVRQSTKQPAIPPHWLT